MSTYDRIRRSADRSEDAGFPPTVSYPDGYPAPPVGDAGQRRRELERVGNPRHYPGPPQKGSGMTANPQFNKPRKG